MAKIEYENSSKYPCVRRRKGMDTWSFRIIQRVDGKVKEINKGGFATQKDAHEARIALMNEIKESPSLTPFTCRKTFETVYKEYIEEVAGRRAFATVKKYHSLFDNHLKSYFGRKQIGKITKADIDSFFTQYVNSQPDKKTGQVRMYSTEFLDGFRKLLNNVFQFAVDKEYIRPASFSRIRKAAVSNIGREKEEGQYIPKELIYNIFKKLDGYACQPAFVIGYYTGMRISEIFGLLWTDIDLDEKLISVERQMLYYESEHKWVFAKPKTACSIRKIPICNELEKYLMELQKKQQQDKEEFGDAYETEYRIGIASNNKVLSFERKAYPIIMRKTNGEFLTPHSVKPMISYIKAELGRNYTFHDLRHTFATNCAFSGMPIVVLKEILGHANYRSTEKYYIHTNDKLYSTALETMNEFSIDEPTSDDNNTAPKLDTTKQVTSETLLGGKFTARGFIPSTE